MTNNNFNNNIIGKLICPVNRQKFNRIVDKYKGNFAYKKLPTWDHFIALLLGQLTNCSSLRQIETTIKFHSNEQYHLGLKQDIHKSTLSDANKNRNWEIFRDVFLFLIDNLKQNEKIEVKEIINLIDSTPIQLKEDWCEKTIRINGLKIHTMFDLYNNMPVYFEITGAKTEDITEARTFDIQKGCTYVFDRGYIDYTWWKDINDKEGLFVSRIKKNCNGFKIVKQIYKYNDNNTSIKEGTILEDNIIEFKQNTVGRNIFKTNNLRLITIKRENNLNLRFFTNDFNRTADDIAKLYKSRWQIELFFKWIKQNLKIKKFLGRSENAVKIQICVAMISFVLLRLAEIVCSICKKIPLKSLITIAKNSLFTRIRIRDPIKKQKDILFNQIL